VGSSFWNGLVNWIKDTLLKQGNISKEDIFLFEVLDKPQDIVDYIKNKVVV
jgi:hypothetical protein